MQFDISDPFFLEFLTAAQHRQVRYMLIGGIAVNFHGVSRNTQDMDIWLAPTNENRDLFYGVLLDLGYTEEEVSDYKDLDFTTFFKCSIGEMPFTIDCLTFVHPNINFDEAEKTMIKYDIGNNLILNVVDYDFLRSMKILTHREKDRYDVARLDEFRKKK
ncbi:MAG: hypothetical protein ACHQIM_07685 [Sphingobacteriales bacterium]